MSRTDDKIVYPRLQGAVNYRSWKQNMISLFKRERAYKIAIGEELKPAEPAHSCNLTKLQFKDRLITAQARSTTVTPQSGESIAGAPAPPPPATPLSRDNIEDTYQSYIQEWKIHEKWLELNSKAYDIMRRHTKDDCKPALRTRTSFKAWSAVENLYQVITFTPIIKAFEKTTSQHSKTFKSKAALTASI